jgi:hypothetical protein
MSENPVPPPEIASGIDTQQESLLARLRKITGVTEMPPLLDEGPKPGPSGVAPVDRFIPGLGRIAGMLERPLPSHEVASGNPPVDKLIPWLRDVFSACVAMGIAALVALAVGMLWLRTWCAKTVQRGMQRWHGRAQRGQASVALTPSEETVVPARPVEAPPAAREPVSAVDVSEPVAAPAARKSSRTLKRAALVTGLVLVALPALYFVKPVRYWVSSLMGRGNAAVITGEEGWLFLRRETEPAGDAADGLNETAAALRAQGAALVIVSVPAKSAVYPEKLTGSGGGELQRQASVSAALKTLASAGTQVIDLGPVLHGLKDADSKEGPVFLPQSSCWSPRGMTQSAAFAAAAVVQQQPGYAILTLQPVMAEPLRVKGRATAGDLETALDSARHQNAWPAPPVDLIRLLKPGKNEPLGSDAASSVLLLGGDCVSLYDDPALGYPVEGLAESQHTGAGFGQYLAWHLSTPLEMHAAREGGLQAAKEWLRRAEEDRRKKKLIIWVVTDGDLLR